MKVAENAASRHLSHAKNLKALMNLNEKENAFGDLPLSLGVKRNAKWSTKTLSLRRR